MQIEIIPQENLAQALALVERVFMQFEAPDYHPYVPHIFARPGCRLCPCILRRLH